MRFGIGLGQVSSLNLHLWPFPEAAGLLSSWRGWTASSRHQHEQQMRQIWQQVCGAMRRSGRRDRCHLKLLSGTNTL